MRLRAWFLVSNAASVTTRRRRVIRVLKASLNLIIRTLARPLLLDVVIISEAADVRIADHVNLKRWQVVQLGELGSPESALALLARRGRAQLRNPRLEPGAPAGEGIRSRPILVADLALFRRRRRFEVGQVGSVHNPPGRAPNGQHRYMSSARDLAGRHNIILGGDWNLSKRLVGAWLPGHRIRAVEVLALAVPKIHKAGHVRPANVRSDHPGVVCAVTFLRGDPITIRTGDRP